MADRFAAKVRSKKTSIIIIIIYIDTPSEPVAIRSFLCLKGGEPEDYYNIIL